MSNEIIECYDLRLLVWSAADKDRLNRIVEVYCPWMGKDDHATGVSDLSGAFINDLSFTWDVHRSHLPRRAFAVVRSPIELLDLNSRISDPVRAQPTPPRLGFVFSGQGGQWFAMGYDTYAALNARGLQLIGYAPDHAVRPLHPRAGC
ncbi:hypothetical protein CP532_5124 [Ophiocordyceps camponoti-leonardi (nom. inval.)]|nr:hypothetical protein CP532_5124 [Ophiocordyceps camponoti-leonardi (nom. inval.)]